MMTTKEAAWDRAQVRLFVKRAKGEAGPAWSMLGERFQRALVAEMAFRVARSQHAADVSTDDMNALFLGMLQEAGFED